MIRVIGIMLILVVSAALAWHARTPRSGLDLEHYTIDVRRSLFFARAVVSELGAPAIDTEHLLAGLLKDPTDPLRALFVTAALSYEGVRQTLQTRAQPMPESVEIPFTKAAFRALIQAEAEADRLRHNDIRPEHLLVGLLQQEGSAATTVLRQHRITLDAALALFDTPSRR